MVVPDVAAVVDLGSTDSDGNYDALARIVWPVCTERLRLRPATAADAEAAWQWRRLPEVSHWITTAPSRFEDFREYFVSPGWLSRALIVELDGQPIGDLMLRVSDAWAQSEVAGQARGVQAELGWCLHPAQQGHGYAVEAVRGLVSVCFGQLGIRRIEANCFADNEPSWRLMERLGMRREMHAVSESLHRNGEWLDGYTYALLASDWKPPEITN